VANPNAAVRATPSLAVVGLACRFPEADDPAALLDAVLTGRRAFRRLPPGRIDLADYYQPDRATSDATYSTRAAVTPSRRPTRHTGWPWRLPPARSPRPGCPRGPAWTGTGPA
jgi:hypothetical protein